MFSGLDAGNIQLKSILSTIIYRRYNTIDEKTTFWPAMSHNKVGENLNLTKKISSEPPTNQLLDFHIQISFGKNVKRR